MRPLQNRVATDPMTSVLIRVRFGHRDTRMEEDVETQWRPCEDRGSDWRDAYKPRNPVLAALGSWRRPDSSPLEPPEGAHPAPHLDFCSESGEDAFLLGATLFVEICCGHPRRLT